LREHTASVPSLNGAASLPSSIANRYHSSITQGCSGPAYKRRWVLPQVPWSKGASYLAVGLDNGNDADKATLIGRDGQLHTVQVPTAHVTAQDALVSRRAMISGKLQDVSAQVQAAIAMYRQDLIGQILPILKAEVDNYPL